MTSYDHHAEMEAHHAAGLKRDAMIEDILRDVAELPDRTSPADWPEAMLVTANELRDILASHLHI